MRLLLLMLLTGCAGLQPGIADDSDTDCGTVGVVSIRLRHGIYTTCQEARFLVDRYRAPLRERWTLIITNGVPGMTLAGASVVDAVGMTWPGRHVIEIQQGHEAVLPHELRHALEAERGEVTFD